MAMKLELGLALPSSPPSKGLGFDLNGDAGDAATSLKKKRGFADAFGSSDDESSGANPTLPLFFRAPASTHHSHDDDDDGRRRRRSTVDAHDSIPRSGGGRGCGGLVGWPPVKSAWRNAGGKYVKVKMEGVAIGRKVDLSLHRSYATLLDALHHMFTKKGGVLHDADGQEHRVGLAVGGRRRCAFTYQDCDGDWMLLGDVPWETFVKSVRRLKILSCSE